MKKQTFRKSSKPGTAPSGNMGRWLVLLIVIIALIFFGLEKMKSKYQGDTLRKAEIQQPVQATPVPPVQPEYGHKVYSSPQTVVKKPKRSPELSGAVAIIVDDMGSSRREAEELLSINLPITFSLIPGLASVKAVAEMAKAAGQEVMVHLPMEPKGYPQQRLEANGLLTSHDSDELKTRTKALLAAVPGAVGANNHMGSAFTEDGERMKTVLLLLKDKGLFFVDSRTSPKSTGYRQAESLGMKSASRNVFLDNDVDVAAIKKQLMLAAEIAKKNGGAIAICHPHPKTIAALKEGMPELQRRGTRFVAASELVR